MHPLLRRSLATVYIETPATGAFTTVARAALPCMLQHTNRAAAATSQDRAQLASERIFVWPAAEYTLPAYCQIEVDGYRWNPVDINAFERFDGPTGAIHHGRVPIRKAT